MYPDAPLDKLLTAKGISFEPLEKQAACSIKKMWLNRFASKVKEKTGQQIFNDFMWHGFSYQYEQCLSGTLALDAYRKCEVEPFYLFNEGARQCFQCNCVNYPDFFEVFNDLYIFPQSMKWTMVFIHEEDLGPYFAELQTTDSDV